MNWTVRTMARSLADYLAPVFPDVLFYADPNQQGTHCPCFFLQQRDSSWRQEMGGAFLRRISLDLTYLLDYHLPDLQRQYEAAAETLDLRMAAFPYLDDEDGTEPVWVRTYDREWRIDLDALHYQFALRERVWLPKPAATKMQTIEALQEEVRQ